MTTHIWQGPSPELTAAQASSIWVSLHRRLGRYGIAVETDRTGRKANFYEIRKIKGEWYRVDLDRVTGPNPMIATLNGSHRFTPFDAELFALHAAYIDELADEIGASARDALKRLQEQLFQIEDAIACVRT